MTKDKALKLALEALEADELAMVINNYGHMVFRKEIAITAIKEALAQQEWVGLTDDEIEHLRNDQPWWMVRDIEAKLKEKNSGHT